MTETDAREQTFRRWPMKPLRSFLFAWVLFLGLKNLIVPPPSPLFHDASVEWFLHSAICALMLVGFVRNER